MITKSLKHFDWLFFTATLILSGVSLMMIYSTGLAGSGELSGQWIKQLVAFLVGVVGLFALSNMDYHFFVKNGRVLYVLSIVFLVAVLVVSGQIRGSQRWFDLGFFNFQPSELSKFALIVLLAKYFQVKGNLVQNFRYILWSFVYVLIPAALIILEPDLGSAVVHVAIWLGVMVVSSMPKRFFIYLFIIFLIVATIGWFYALAPYQKDRLYTFFSPTADPLGRGYNVIQSIVAIGSGGVLGTGLARGLQSQLRFLPERQTDFIFASTAEELGFIGAGLVLFLLGFIMYRIIKIMKGSRDLFGMYISGGVFSLIFVQTIVNIGMNLGLLPVTGITLPFLSYGGSSLIINLWPVGLVESIAQHSVPVRFD